MIFCRTELDCNGSLSLYDLNLQRKYRISSIEHNSGIVRYRKNYGIIPALMCIHEIYMANVTCSLTDLIVIQSVGKELTLETCNVLTSKCTNNASEIDPLWSPDVV